MEPLPMKLLLLIFVFTLQSCVIYNATKNKEKICEIHKTEMKKTMVRAWYGKPASWDFGNKSEYINAKESLHLGCVKRPPVKKFAIIYHCKECVKIKESKL